MTSCLLDRKVDIIGQDYEIGGKWLEYYDFEVTKVSKYHLRCGL